MCDIDGSEGERLTIVYHTSAGTVNTLKEQQHFVSILEQFKLTHLNKQEDTVSNHPNVMIVSNIIAKFSDMGNQTTLM